MKNMPTNYNNRVLSGSFITALLLFIGICFSGCEDNPGEFDLDDKYIESQTELTLVDTFSLAFSTMKFDTLIGNSTGSILLGNYTDEVLGSISTKSYFQLGIPSSASIASSDDYDSLCLVIRFNGYSIGDTTSIQKIYAYRLTENIELNDDEVITCNTAFNYDNNPIGSFEYTPRPSETEDSLLIRIDDSIGQDFFQKLEEHSELLTDYEYFKDYFPGIVLVPDGNCEDAIIGFSVSDTKLRLYTTRPSSTDEQIEYDFSITDTDLQYNEINHNYESTVLTNLTTQEEELPSTSTNGLVYLMGGTGFTIRIDIPSLSELQLFERGTLVSAELIIYPEVSQEKSDLMPQELNLYKGNKHNEGLEIVRNSTGEVVTGVLQEDEFYSENIYYTFNLTNYLIDELSDSYIDPDNGLIATLPSTNKVSGFSQLTLDAQNTKTKLKIYYLYY